MSRLLLTLSLCAVFTALAPLGLLAGQDEHKSHAGYVDVDFSKAVGDKEPSVQVFLEPALLKLMASAGKEIDAEVVGLVNDLSFVRVNVYEGLSTENSNVLKTVDAQVKALLAKDWKTVVKVRQDKNETVDVLMKVSGEKIVGFAIFVAEPDELVFVNIAGNMDPETFGAKLGKIATKASGGELKIEGLSGLIDSIKNSTKTDAAK